MPRVGHHLQHLAAVRDRADDAGGRVAAVLLAFALLSRQHDGSELAALLHRGQHVVEAQQHLRDFVGDLLAEAALAGQLRDDVPPDELASYVLGALSAAGGLRSEAAVRRLVEVTLDGLRPVD